MVTQRICSQRPLPAAPAALITLAGYFPAACQRDQFSSKLVQADGYGFDPRLPGVTTVVWLEPLFVVTVMPP